ncbi:MAG: SOS response-associated peptidase [Candidatus Latescibacterota bacterium]|nr:SOS response-associated peptidase [Candidatus Latescibacterota bacterium]
MLRFMCGRFTLHHSTEDVAQQFAVEQAPPELTPRYNIAPSEPVACIIRRESQVLQNLRWGLVPFWARDPAIGNRMINARAESLRDKPAFRNAFACGRCLIPASGYFEWQRIGEHRVPMLIRRESAQLFAMAGLYECWRTPDEAILRTCTIITTEANGFAANIHHRMPAILPPEEQEIWLDRGITDVDQLQSVLKPYPFGDLAAHAVSQRVNKADEEDAKLIEPVTPPPDPQQQLELSFRPG